MSASWFHHISPTGTVVPIASLAAALEAVHQGGYLWLHYCQPTREQLSTLIGPLGLHPLSIEDCFDEKQIPKIEDFPKNTFIIFNSFSYASRTLSIDEIDLFIGASFLVTISQREDASRRLVDDVGRIMATDTGSALQGPAFLMHVILDSVVDQKFLAIEAFEAELDAAEESLLADASRFNIAELVRLRRGLLSLRKSLFHEREILVRICRKDCVFISENAIFHYRDIYDHLAKFFELTESYREIVTSLMEMYLSMLNNQMTRAANDTNVIVRRLTLITTIFMPLTLLAGIGGMSEWSMMTGPENWRVAYPAFMLAMVVVGFANYYLLARFERKSRRGDTP
jgi:magnesium transporter